MGSWGTELYQNDTTLDVKSQFEKMYYAGKSVQEITEQLLEEYREILGDPEEESLFWMALADTQWEFGVLLPQVLEQALYWIEKESSIKRLYQMSGEVKKEQRENAMRRLKVKLCSTQPPARKAVRRRMFRCKWKLGDVFAYKIEGTYARERGFLGRYLLIRKVDERIWHPEHIIPIVYVKLTKDETLPTNTEEYDQLEYVQTWFSRYEERLWPLNGKRMREDIEEKLKIKYEVDEYGLLPQYRQALICTSQKSIPDKLIYVGNFTDAAPPPKEFIPHTKRNIGVSDWDEFEEKMLKMYCQHNLRELKIYSSKP